MHNSGGSRIGAQGNLMKKNFLATAVPAVMVAAAATTALAAPAQAATHSAGSVYVHGTTHLASFATNAECARYARSSWDLLSRNRSTATPLGAPSTNLQGQEFRFMCYPAAHSRWSYATAYTSKTGVPLRSSDLYIDPTGRDTTQKSADTESVWTYEHENRSPNGSITIDKCTANLSAIVGAVKRSSKARLVSADGRCYEYKGKTGYSVSYLGSSSTAGVAKDRALAQSVRILDALGYLVPGIDYGSTSHS